MRNNMLRGKFENINLKKYYHQTDIIQDYKNILQDIEDIIRNRQVISDAPFVSRVFINGGTRDDFGFRISNTPPTENEALVNWLERITQAESFCAVINGVNGWSEEISSRILDDFTEEWINNFGIPSQGVDVYTFMGRYNITPFGIHKDREHTFLYHLGPGIKKAWVWDPEIIDVAPLIRSDSFNLKDTLSYAYPIILQPGDALFIPQDWYHVLENPEFSVTLGIAPYEKRKSELLLSFIKTLMTENTGNEQDLSVHISNDSHPENYADIILADKFKNGTLYTIAENGMSNLINNLKSNMFFKYNSPPRKPEPKNYRYFGGFVIGENDGEKITVHCRGGSLKIKSDIHSQLLKLEALIKSPDFLYSRKECERPDFIHSFFEHLIKFGVLV
ncbi:hypothetical protein MUA03_17475 [Enterobacteriaceae bacterium H16N7]|nr:hypothetical protein [Dryocola clanedunensis]